jgi:hypothetical protein
MGSKRTETLKHIKIKTVCFISRKEDIMELKDFCKGLEHELTAWKAKLFDMQGKIETLPSADKQRMLAHTEDLRMLVVEVDERIDRLRTECPTVWDGYRAEIEESYAAIGIKYKDALQVIGAGNFGG